MSAAPYTNIDFVCPTTGLVGVSLKEYANSAFSGRTNAAIYRPGDPEESPFLPIDTIDPVDHENLFDVWFASGVCEKNVNGGNLVFVVASVAKSLQEAREPV